MSHQNVDRLKPQPKQVIFLKSSAVYRLFGGAKGGGKSFACRTECVRQALSRPGIHGLALRRTLPEIYNNMTMPMMKELIQAAGGKKIYTYNDNKKTITFLNHDSPEMRSKITFGYCMNKKDLLRYQGIEYDFLCIEELTHRPEDRFRELMGSKRSTKKRVISNFFGSTNPGNIGHMRVKRIFVDRNFTENEDPGEYDFIPANVYDNVILMEREPNYLKTLKALPEKLRRAYMHGDRSVFAGQYFTEFRESLHVIAPTIPRMSVKKRIICLDYGYKAPSAVYRIAQLDNDQCIVYRELYVTQHTYKQLAKLIIDTTPEDEEIEACIVDPAIVAKRSDTTGSTGEEEMQDMGLYIEGADNERVKGRNNVRQYLTPVDDPNHEEPFVLLKITRNCKNLIRTLPMLMHDEKKVEDVNTKQEDHGPDALRYGLLYLGEKTVSLEEISDLNENFVTDAMIKAKRNIEERHSSDGRGSGSSMLNVDF